MNLEFIKVGNEWVAEFKVESDFNLHVEKGVGNISISQSSVEGGAYDYVKQLSNAPLDKVVDIDFVGVIYPKYIKIECATLPTLAIVTSNGEITEGGVETILNTPI